MPYVNVEPGVRLYYEAVGHGHPIVFIAGWAYSGEIWERQVTAFSGDYLCVTVDKRGHGRSDKPTLGYSYAQLADDLNSVLQELGIDHATMVGWSMGGCVVAKLAARHPARVAQIVTVGSPIPKLIQSPDLPLGRTADEAGGLIADEQRDRALTRWEVAKTSVHNHPGDQTLWWMWMVSMKTPSWSAIETYRNVLAEDLRPDLRHIRAPWLIVQGRHDAFVSVELGEWAHANLPGSRLQILEGSGHVPFIEETDRFNNVLRAFVTINRTTS